MAKFRYRVWQFWHALWGRPTASDLAVVENLLSPGLFDLFKKMPPAEQAHALRVFAAVKTTSAAPQALLEAALLHDVGKSLHPLFPWERAWVVLGKAFFPEKMPIWGQSDPAGWRKPFVVSEQHAEWGARMAAAAGAGDLTVRLIREHQTASPAGLSAEEAVLLSQLKEADNQS